MLKRSATVCTGLATVLLTVVPVGAASAGDAPHRVVAADQRTVVVAAAGDIACSPRSPYFRTGKGVGTNCRQRDTALAAERLNPDAVLALGDNQYDRAELANFQMSFAPSWGRFLHRDPARNRLWPVAGNHELDFGPNSGYWPSFNGGTEANPNPTGVAGVTGQGWYSMQLGRWQILALNSECGRSNSYLGVNGCKPGSPQYRWLRRQLSDPAKCTLAMFHRPRYTWGEHSGEPLVQPLWRLLAQAKAELLLTGHNHDYERYARLDASGSRSRSGLRQFVVGTGGKQLYSWGTQAKGRRPQVKNNTTAGVLKLRLKPTSYAWRFVPAEFAGNGRFVDSGKATCRGPGAPLPAR